MVAVCERRASSANVPMQHEYFHILISARSQAAEQLSPLHPPLTIQCSGLQGSGSGLRKRRLQVVLPGAPLKLCSKAMSLVVWQVHG